MLAMLLDGKSAPLSGTVARIVRLGFASARKGNALVPSVAVKLKADLQNLLTS